MSVSFENYFIGMTVVTVLGLLAWMFIDYCTDEWQFKGLTLFTLLVLLPNAFIFARWVVELHWSNPG